MSNHPNRNAGRTARNPSPCEIRAAREMTPKPFGVNIMLMSPNAGEAAQICCEERIAVVTTGAGHPGEFMQEFATAGITVVRLLPQQPRPSGLHRPARPP